MRRQVSVKELKKYCEKNTPRQVTYYSENQDWHQISDPCRLRMHFQDILVYENPNLVCLKSGTNTLCFNKVRFVEIDTEASILGTILTLYCGDSPVKKTYKIVAA